MDEREIQIGIKINEFVIEYGMEVNRAIVSVKLFWRRGRGGVCGCEGCLCSKISYVVEGRYCGTT